MAHGVLLTYMTMKVSPGPESTSTSTAQASMPFTAAEQTFASMRGDSWQEPTSEARRRRGETFLLCALAPRSGLNEFHHKVRSRALQYLRWDRLPAHRSARGCFRGVWRWES